MWFRGGVYVNTPLWLSGLWPVGSEVPEQQQTGLPSAQGPRPGLPLAQA